MFPESCFDAQINNRKLERLHVFARCIPQILKQQDRTSLSLHLLGQDWRMISKQEDHLQAKHIKPTNTLISNINCVLQLD